MQAIQGLRKYCTQANRFHSKSTRQFSQVPDGFVNRSRGGAQINFVQICCHRKNRNRTKVIIFTIGCIRRNGVTAAKEAAALRIRPIIMTTLAMVVGMIPMAAGFGEGGDQASPLARAVIGGLIASTFATLIVLPLIFSWIQKKTSIVSVSLDPEDKESRFYVGDNA